MNRILIKTLLTAATLLVSAGAFAQVLEQATIPFDFTVGQRSFPAGNYVVVRVAPGILEVRGWKGKQLLRAVTNVSPNQLVRDNPHKLVFHVYSNQYFLSEIRPAVGEASGRLWPSGLERRLQQEQAAAGSQRTTQVALSH